MVPTSDLLGAVASLPTVLVAAAPDFGRAAGRLHPLVVHFPIALALVAVAVEWWRALTRQPGLSPITRPLLWLAAAAAVASTASGWLNAAYERGGDGGSTLFLHRWIGTATSIGLVALAAWCQSVARAMTRASADGAAQLGSFRWAALVVGLAVGATGHLGGDMVYGEGYLTKVLFPPSSAKSDALAGGETPTEGPVEVGSAETVALSPNDAYFIETVLPILEAHCFECHSARKQKGGLRMDTRAWLFNGDEEDWTVLPGKSAESLFLARIVLDRDDPDAMPPEGPGLTADEQAAIRKWIDDGAAYPDASVIAAASDAAADQATIAGTATTGAPAPALSTAEVRAKAETAAKALVARGVLVQPLAIDSPYLDVNAARAEPALGDADAALLADLAPLVVNLNLAKSAITDAGLAAIGPMPVLEKLRLDETAVGDAGLAALGSLPKLESVNLVGTKVTAACRDWLHAQPALRRVYVWRTAVEARDAAQALATKFEVVGADLPLAQPTTPPMPEDPKPEDAKPEGDAPGAG
ncbi:MAG: hypothetical protein RI967_1445 [Planctomycetota bacterium]